MIYLKQPGEGEGHIGPFDSEVEAEKFRDMCFSSLMPWTIEILGSTPPYLISPERMLDVFR